MQALIPTLLLASSCIRVSEYPFVGDCAVYPDDQYEFGQIGIGECISGPNGLRFVGDADNPTLLITNANPYQVFDGGSLLALPMNNIDIGDGTNEIHTLDAKALNLPSMAMGIEVFGDLGMVALRESEGARTRVSDDRVYLLDLTDPSNPVPSTRGTDGSETVEVLSDPVDVAIDSETGLAFVANRTDHNISVLDTTSDTISVIKPWTETTVTAAVYEDLSGTGGQARMTSVDVLGDGLLLDDIWTLTWTEGSWRIWIPTEDGLFRTSTQLQRNDAGALLYNDNAMGTELRLEDTDESVLSIDDPSFSPATGRMLYASEGSIWGASTGDYIGDWSHDQRATLEPGLEPWMGWLGGPNVTLGLTNLHIFFDAQPDDLGGESPSMIGTGVSEDGLLFSLSTDPALAPVHAHEGNHISDPHVVFDTETLLWRMMYSAFDGETWTIGHAVSEDLITWTSSATPVLASALGAAAPTVHNGPGRWHMWFSEWDGTAWSIAGAESRDGTRWTRIDASREFGPGVVTDDPYSPPSVAMQGSTSNSFQVRGEHSGVLGSPLQPGYAFAAVSAGWSIEVIAGAWIDLGQSGSESNGGVRVDSVIANEDGTEQVWTTLTTRSGKQSIGTATADLDGTFNANNGPVFSGGEAKFESAGVSHPVVFSTGDSLGMLYAGERSGKYTVGLATSPDGLNWTSEGQVFKPGSGDWDRISIIPNSVVDLGSGGLRMWYSGYDGSRWRIGSATSTDGGLSWSRDSAARGYQFGLGEPGGWDDTGVKDAWVIADESGEHLWYSGFDGDNWRIGYAFRPGGQAAFERTILFETDEGRPIIDYPAGVFHRSDVTRPVVTPRAEGFSLTYAGWSADTVRVGRAFGHAPDRINRTPNLPRVGDTLTFSTEYGDEDAEAISLDGFTENRQTTGIGLTTLYMDNERGFLYAGSKLYPGIFVIDVRDDTDAINGFFDKNYLDVEAVLLLNTSSVYTGFRQFLTIPGSDTLYALVDTPASVVGIDISGVTDDEYADYINNPATGYLAAPRSGRDEGADSMSFVGPGQMLLHPDGRRLFISNFNRNSITTYDLTMGPYGMPISDTPNVGENPYAMTLSPDGNTLVFGNYTGVLDDNLSHSSLGLIDVNEESNNYLEVMTWIVNL